MHSSPTVSQLADPQQAAALRRQLLVDLRRTAGRIGRISPTERAGAHVCV